MATGERRESCWRADGDRMMARLGRNPSRHGFDGWLHTERAIPNAAFRDRDLRAALFESARAALKEKFHLASVGNSDADPNDWRIATDESVGIRFSHTRDPDVASSR